MCPKVRGRCGEGRPLNQYDDSQVIDPYLASDAIELPDWRDVGRLWRTGRRRVKGARLAILTLAPAVAGLELNRSR
jgi:hypothetical protein